MVNNIWLFVPLGAGLYRLCPDRRVLWIALLLTAGIEITQYLTGLGDLQIDDILENFFGAVVGFVAACLLRPIPMKKYFCVSACSDEADK